MSPNKLIEVTNLKDSEYTQMTDPRTWKIDPEASFIHICINETVHGFDVSENFPWHLIPKDVAIVGDMSSCIGTKPIDWNRFDVVYAGVQKNMGPTGCTIIIANKKILGQAAKDTPIMCDWTTFENSPGTYYNTPPVWCIYVTGLNVSYMNQRGGIPVYQRETEIKAKMLYDTLDASGGYYVNKTDKAFRSLNNVNFRIPKNRDLEKKLMTEAEQYRILNIAGHPKNPGIRCSIYNAMPIVGVELLC